MAGYQLEIVTPKKTVYSGQVVSLQAPGSEGSFGIMAGHMPLLTSLQIGVLRFAEEGGSEARMAVSGGFAEVGQERVTILAETAERADEIDIARAESSRLRAEERLASREEEKVDVVRAQLALSRALNRLKVGG